MIFRCQYVTLFTSIITVITGYAVNFYYCYFLWLFLFLYNYFFSLNFNETSTACIITCHVFKIFTYFYSYFVVAFLFLLLFWLFFMIFSILFLLFNFFQSNLLFRVWTFRVLGHIINFLLLLFFLLVSSFSCLSHPAENTRGFYFADGDVWEKEKETNTPLFTYIYLLCVYIYIYFMYIRVVQKNTILR